MSLESASCSNLNGCHVGSLDALSSRIFSLAVPFVSSSNRVLFAAEILVRDMTDVSLLVLSWSKQVALSVTPPGDRWTQIGVGK